MSIYYFLYVKTHNITGLKYLGQTNGRRSYYNGSGVYWKLHLKKHGYNISTEWIAAFDNKDDLKTAGLFWSKHWNVVESEEWANLKEEAGESGGKYSAETIKKLRISRIGRKATEETKKKMSEARKGKKRAPFTDEHKLSLSKARKGKVPWNKDLTKETDIRVLKDSLSKMGNKHCLGHKNSKKHYDLPSAADPNYQRLWREKKRQELRSK